MNLWLLFLVAVVILLLVAKEGFEATPTIKDPTGWDAAEITRIRKLVTPESTLTESEIRDIVGGFWSYRRSDGQLKGWKNETTQITTADITNYLQMKNVPSAKQAQYRELLKAYYIDQGQSVFQQARNYIVPSSPEEPPIATGGEVSRPLSTDPQLRTTIASYTAIPVNSNELDKYIKKVQDFYDIVYLPNKQPPNQTQISSFVKDIPVSEIPANKKPGLEGVIDYWFTQSATPEALLEGTPEERQAPVPQQGDGGAGPTELGVPRYTQGPIGSGPGIPSVRSTSETTKNIFGPLYTGLGESSVTGGDSSKTNVYPGILGGFSAGGGTVRGIGGAPTGAGRDFDLPSLGSLGLNDNSQFLPFSRTPGDQEGAFASRIGNTGLSNVPGAKTDPVPFLSDFSAFFR